MNIPNTNPVSNPGIAPATAAPITPKSGPVLAERKAQAAKKSVMTVDARLYGVKPMALSKYINDMIKVTPFSGVTYNKTMLSIVKQNSAELKQTRQGINQIHTSLLAFNVDFFKAHEENIRYLKELKELPKKPSLTSDKLTEIVQIDKSNRRDAIRRDRESQTQATPDDPAYLELKETNATLEKILKEGAKESKEAKKSGGGLMGFLKHPINFIWDMLGSIPGGRLIGGLAAAAGLGAILMHILPNTLKALYEMIVPQPLKDFLKNIKIMASSFMKDPLGFIGERIASIGKLLYDMFQDQFIAPIVYNVKVAMANITAFARHPISAENRKAELDKLMADIGNKPSEIKRDVGGSLLDILVHGKVGEGRITTTPAEKTGEWAPGSLDKLIEDAIKTPPVGTMPETYEGKSISPKSIQKTIAKVRQYDAMIEASAKKYNINADFLRSIIAQESGGNPAAESYKYDPDTGKYILDKKGNKIPIARGIAQFTKDTGKMYGLKINDKIDERLDPEKSIDAAAHYLKVLQNKTGSEVGAAAAYNAGPGTYESVLSGRRLFAKETLNYMHNVPAWKSQFEGLTTPITSPPTDANAIKQTSEQMNSYMLGNYDFLRQYYSNSLNLQQQTAAGVNKLVGKEPIVSQTVNAPQLGPITR